ncbi:MAG: ATP-dependent Clp protease adapter ClpS [Leptolyngbyaceae cyanobacterium RU_5_1]|nr:ATP-dependent Clp protease adapter ClpS [Leptolyngbyaceae cyanobacterium RU_5_1]
MSFQSNRVVAIAPLAVLSSAAPTVAPERSGQVTRQHFPNYKVIVLNDDFNTFEHVISCLVKYIPGMSPDHARKLADQIHFEGQAIVWVGPLEQAEFYHMQLDMEGLTMAPLEAA